MKAGAFEDDVASVPFASSSPSEGFAVGGGVPKTKPTGLPREPLVLPKPPKGLGLFVASSVVASVLLVAPKVKAGADGGLLPSAVLSGVKPNPKGVVVVALLDAPPKIEVDNGVGPPKSVLGGLVDDGPKEGLPKRGEGLGGEDSVVDEDEDEDVTDGKAKEGGFGALAFGAVNVADGKVKGGSVGASAFGAVDVADGKVKEGSFGALGFGAVDGKVNAAGLRAGVGVGLLASLLADFLVKSFSMFDRRSR
jgi:hypothetical protein